MKKQEKQKKINHQKKAQKITSSYNPEVMSIVKIAIIVLVILAVVYFFTALATGKIKFGKDKPKDEEITIQYEEILAGETFNQVSEDYLVLFYDSSTTEAGLYETLLRSYSAKEGSLKYYKVDMANPMNQMYKTKENSNLYVSKSADLKIKDAVLLRLAGHQVSSVYEGKEAIQEYFNNFSK